MGQVPGSIWGWAWGPPTRGLPQPNTRLPGCLGSLQEQEHVPKAHSPGTEPKKQEHFKGDQNFPFPQPVPINKTRSDQELTPASPLHDQDKTPGAVVGAVPGSIHPHPLLAAGVTPQPPPRVAPGGDDPNPWSSSEGSRPRSRSPPGPVFGRAPRSGGRRSPLPSLPTTRRKSQPQSS